MSDQSKHTSVDNKRIAKNTIMLYFRMLVLMAIGLFTSRVILKSLGVDDYGINSVIAGFLSMFGIITSSMSSAISRFITVELGREDSKKLKSVFSTSISVQFFMGILVVILIESIGIWFLNNRMNIPEGREAAAQWCLHCATFTTFVSLMNIPFNSTIVAHERMSAFAYMTILDAALKLAICYALYISPFDKLKTYAVLLAFVSIFTTSIYWIYCRIKFEECSFKLKFDKQLFKEIWSFAGWNFFGQTAWILNTQGINMLMNIFFNVAVNAARGIAVQVNGIIQNFVTNFMTALNPQITKSYACGEKAEAFKLACRGARFSFFIMFILALPVLLESTQILTIWLGTPPEQADAFVVWTILSTFTILLGNTLVTLQMAHGDLRKYQLWITFVGCLPFPLTWVLFKMGFAAITSYFVFVTIYWVLIFVRFILVNESTGITAKEYLGGVIVKCHVVGVVATLLPLAIRIMMPESILRLLLVCSTSVLTSAVAIYYIGLEKSERTIITGKVLSIIRKKS